MIGLDLTCLGRLTISWQGNPLPEFKSRKGKALLCYLAVTGQSHSRSVLAGLLWSDIPEANARTNLRKLLSRLPTVISDHLMIARQAIGLDPTRPVSVDVLELQAGLVPDASIGTVRQAVTLYEGDFLAGFSLPDAPLFEEWASAQRARLRQEVLAAMHKLVTHFDRQGEYDLAIDYAQKLLTIEPWQEETHRELMRLLAITGQRSAAITQYERCRRLLETELGVSPSRTTVSLYQAIKNDEVTLAVTTDGRGGSVPNNLPLQTTEFIGRKDALEEIRRLLQDTRLVTIIGPGGIGKTRLAIEVAAEAAGPFRHGVSFISLAPISTSGAVAQAISEGIGLSLATGEAPRVQLLNYLRNRRQLLVVDNFEHVIEAANLLDSILRGAPHVKILVTSRAKLNLSGEAVYSLLGLESNNWYSIEFALKSEAVQLFLSTARQRRSDFRLEAGDMGALKKIFERVEGSPLGILLAASWVDMLPVAEISAEIEKGFDFLKVELRDLPERHHSIRAIFETTWRLLSAEERKLFAAVSVFRGGFTRQAAKNVANASLRQLAKLADKSLLSPDPESGRYTVHELLRQYGEASLQRDRDQFAVIKKAHARHYAGFMDQAWYRITHGDQPRALEDIEADIENVRAAWRYLVAEGDPRQALRMFRPLWFIYDIRGWHVAGAALFQESIEAASARPASQALCVLEALCTGELGFFKAVLGDIDDALILGEEATAELRELNAPNELAFAIGHRCVGLYFTGQLARMKEICFESLAASEERWNVMSAHIWIANAALMEGNIDEASRHLDVFEKLLGPVQDYWFSYYLNMLRHLISWGSGDISTSRQILEKALTNVRVINYRRGIQYSLAQLANISMALEDYPAAKRFILESLQVTEELGSTAEQISSLVDLASVAAAEGRPQEALELAATAYAHPLSHQNTPFNMEPIRSRAEAVQRSLHGVLKRGQATAAWNRGLTADFDEFVTELIDSRSKQQTAR